MANSYFQFKQFRIDQDHSAMKVGTDGVILGAWCSVQPEEKVSEDALKILDIGCGTGLIALMVAQRTDNVCIDAIDIDAGATQDAKYNFFRSPWPEKLKCHNISLQDFTKRNARFSYSNIISNPPFFVNSLQAPDMSRNMARHTALLSYDDLLKGVEFLLAEYGVFSVILPFDNADVFESLAAKYGIYCFRKLNVFPKPDVPIKRVAMEFGRHKKNLMIENLVIETTGRHQYSDEYKKLTADFYLKF